MREELFCFQGTDVVGHPPSSSLQWVQRHLWFPQDSWVHLRKAQDYKEQSFSALSINFINTLNTELSTILCAGHVG